MSAIAEHEITAHRQQVAIIRAMTPKERMQRALQMNRTSRELLAAGFRHRHPEWAEVQVHRAVAERILYARTG
jgi:hypothetical protein